MLTKRDQSLDRRVLYISPLRALGNDVQKNLMLPLGRCAPSIRVCPRSR